jgi:hypothetical protein
MTTANAPNGKAPARKQLSDQLDRLDGIIDSLAEGLNATVADACREGTRAAVREVLLELVNNADLLAAVRASAAPPVPVAETPVPTESPSFWNRAKAGVRGAVTTATGAVRTLVKSVEAAVQPATDALKLTGTTKTVIAVALGVGLAAGAASLVCPTWVSAAVTGVTGAAAVVAGYVGATVNAVFARLRTAE